MAYGTYHIVWKIGEELNVNNFVTFEKNGRCSCKYRVAFGTPCYHEMAVRDDFNPEKYAPRWLCSTMFSRIHKELTPTINLPNKDAYVSTIKNNEEMQ